MPKLDWISHHDPRSRDYPIRALLPADGGATKQRTLATWKPGPILDQGQDGACVGFGWTGEALMSPVRVRADQIRAALVRVEPSDQSGAGDYTANDVAHDVYKTAQRLDDWPGEDYDGTSVLAGAKAMKELGFVGEYRWCFTIEDVIDTLIHHGPVVLGVNWRESMYTPDRFGELTATGPIVGGHCIVASGYHPHKIVHPVAGRPPRPMIQLTNSWGSGWGYHGQAWIETSAVATLLVDGGEACVPLHRSYGPA